MSDTPQTPQTPDEILGPAIDLIDEPYTSATFPPPEPPPDFPTPSKEAFDEAIERLRKLRNQSNEVENDIQRLLAYIGTVSVGSGLHKTGRDLRPLWGPCTRCGHVWRGHRPEHPPRGCTRCGSTGWRVTPHTANARLPTDPPNPRWGKNRRTGLPTIPFGLPEEVRKRLRLEQQELLKRQGRTAKSAAEAASPASASPAAPTLQPSSSRLTPPPRPEDVSLSLAAAPSLEAPPAPRRLVPPPSVRFISEPAIAHPDDGVPIRIEPNGSITELQENVESDGSIILEEDYDAS